MHNFHRAANPHIVKMAEKGSKKFPCVRCKRKLSESRFTPLYGNSSRKIFYLHPVCVNCRKQIEAGFDGHPLYSPDVHLAAQQVYQGMRGGASARGIIVAIDANDIVAQYLRQDGRCALSGEKLRHEKGIARGERFSVDRISSEGNYTLDNVQLLSGRLNVMKNDMPQDRFIQLCMRVAANALNSLEDNEE